MLLRHSIQPMQQFSYTTGKNATDSALIIDAMDLLYAGNLDRFCIVSSDSDFTRLAGRIREQGLQVYGFLEHRTPQPFVAACDTFVYLENLAEESAPKPAAPPPLRRDRSLSRLLAEAVDAASGDDSHGPRLSSVGSNLSRLASDFDPRTWGSRSSATSWAPTRSTRSSSGRPGRARHRGRTCVTRRRGRGGGRRGVRPRRLCPFFSFTPRCRGSWR